MGSLSKKQTLDQEAKQKHHSQIPLFTSSPTMSNQKKDQSTDPPSQESNGLLFKNRAFKETKSTNKEMELEEIQKEGHFNVLYAFFSESSSVSTAKASIIKDLKEEFNITHKTHKDLKKQVLREVPVDSGEGERKIRAVEGSPLKLRFKVSEKDLLYFQEKLNKAPAYDKDWGKVNPASLVDRLVHIRLSLEDGYNLYRISAYDADMEMHYLVPQLGPVPKASKEYEPQPINTGFVDPCNWIDLRHIPAEDTLWEGGHPGFPIRTYSLKPGQTILRETSTARRKKPVNEIGKTASGIPIFCKGDPGDSRNGNMIA